MGNSLTHTKQVSIIYKCIFKLDVKYLFILIFDFFTTEKNMKGKNAPSLHLQSTKESTKKCARWKCSFL